MQYNDTEQGRSHLALVAIFDINNKTFNKKKKDNKDSVSILRKKNIPNKIMFKLPFVPPLSPLPLCYSPEAFSSPR